MGIFDLKPGKVFNVTDQQITATGLALLQQQVSRTTYHNMLMRDMMLYNVPIAMLCNIEKQKTRRDLCSEHLYRKKWNVYGKKIGS